MMPHTTEPQVHEGHQEDIRRSDLSVPGQPLCRDYKAQLTRSMKYLASDPLVRFIGYGVKIGGRAMGTLQTVDDSQLIEMPVAENLMVGFAIGLALKGLKPVVFIERFDFILNALDAIVNHLDKIHTISRGEFQPTMILRVVVGNRDKPLFTGETHTQDFSEAMESLVSFPVIQLRSPETIFAQYKAAHAYLGKRPACNADSTHDRIPASRVTVNAGRPNISPNERSTAGRSTMLVEYKDLM